jgi:very-short-patch-repair endonuclease
LKCRLIVEIDGGQHAEQAEQNNKRTAWLESQGFRVIRFWNNDVLQNLDGVLESIANALMEGPLTPAFSRKGRE